MSRLLSSENARWVLGRAVVLTAVLALIVALFGQQSKAERATVDEARQVCRNWLQYMTFHQGSWAGDDTPQIMYSQEIIENGEVLGYNFAISPGGFVVVPVIKELPPIKAYSDKCNLDPDETEGFPLLLREVLEHRIDLYRKFYGSLDAIQPAEGEVLLGQGHRVEWEKFLKSDRRFRSDLAQNILLAPTEEGPLLTTTWHQRAPYNNFCPMGDSSRRTVVGCVATASAQIMKYWNWPYTGTGGNTYTWDGDQSCGGDVGGGNLSATFSDRYDWLNMPDNCDSGCNPTERNALAEICYEVGVAFEMDYGSCGSSIPTYEALDVFPNDFKYKRTIERVNREDYLPATWFDLIRSEINQERPTLYRILGHAIVCDGWRDTGGLNQYHMNYGWADSFTTWYSIDSLYCPWEGCTTAVEYLIRFIEPTCIDEEAPEIACPPGIVLEGDNNCQAVYSGPMATAGDDCDDSPVITSDPGLPVTFSGVGDHYIEYTATDGSGKSSTCTQTVTVVDVTPPIITCPPDIVLEGDENCEVVYSGPPAAAADNCDASPSITSDPPLPATLTGVGDHYITYTATDASGNSSDCVQTVTVTDVTPPMITCPPDIVLEGDENCEVVYSGPRATAADNCDARPTITSVPPLPATFTGVGDHYIEYTATDGSGNSSTCRQMVTVVDLTPPMITCPPDIVLEGDENCEVVYSGPRAAAADNCDARPTITSVPPLPATFTGVGDHYIEYTATDGSGNSSTCRQMVTVVDLTPPMITCPPDIVLEGDENCEVVYSGPRATAADNCDARPTITSVPPLPATFTGVGDHYIEYTATDGSGNSSTCRQMVTVVDLTPPLITCPPDVAVEPRDLDCEVTYDGPPATATDNCDPSPIITSDPVLPAVFGSIGDHEIVFNATDFSMNSSYCTMTVTVLPTSYCLKQEAIDSLEALKPTGSRQIDKEIDKVILHIEESLDLPLWGDVKHVGCKHGHMVFNEEKTAIVHLAKEMDKKKFPLGLVDDFDTVIDMLLDADLILAETHLADAVAFGGEEKHIEKAEAEMVRAAEERSLDRPTHAVDHYRKAHDHACKARAKPSGGGVQVGEEDALPLTFRLLEPVPNPFSGSAVISFEIPEATKVSLRVYDLSGRLVSTVVDACVTKGSHRIEWDGTDDVGARAGGGIYFVRLVAGSSTSSRKVVLVR